MPLPATPDARRAACRETQSATDGGAAASLDHKQWLQILARYRDPDPGRSVYELLITAVPFFALWAIMLLCLRYGYWLSLLLAVPAAGFLVRLFMIQHDCGHGSFFRHRLANNTVGRVIGVLTLTPYDYWRRTHALHHAGSGNLDRRGKGDVTTLTVAEYLNLPRWRRAAYRLSRNPLILLRLGPIYIFLLKHRLPIELMDGGKELWISVMATNLGIAGDRGRHECSGRRPELPARAAADHAARLLDRDLAVLRPAPVRGDLLGPSGSRGASTPAPCRAARISICRRRFAGSPPTSASTTSITWRAESRAIG